MFLLTGSFGTGNCDSSPFVREPATFFLYIDRSISHPPAAALIASLSLFARASVSWLLPESTGASLSFGRTARASAKLTRLLVRCGGCGSDCVLAVSVSMGDSELYEVVLFSLDRIKAYGEFRKRDWFEEIIKLVRVSYEIIELLSRFSGSELWSGG